MGNIYLFVFDFLITLPITLIRLMLIYFFGSKYAIESFGFLDVMMHADKKYFNQEDADPTIDTINDDIRVKINLDSRYNKDILVINNNKSCLECKKLKKLLLERDKVDVEIPKDSSYPLENDAPVKEMLEKDIHTETNDDFIEKKNKLLQLLDFRNLSV